MEITVIGQARREVLPTVAKVVCSVSVEGEQRADVLQSVAGAVAQLTGHLTQLSEAGVVKAWAAESLRSHSWQPYDQQGQAQPLRYSASRDVSAQFVRTDHLGEAVARWAEMPTVSISGVLWELESDVEHQVRDELLADALRDARRRAGVIAHAAGHNDAVQLREVSDPGLLSGSDPGQGTPPAYGGVRMTAYSAGDGQTLTFEPGPIEVTVSVHARFSAADSGHWGIQQA